MKRLGFAWGLSVLMSLMMLVPSASADQWQILGPRAIGMGGAHVAVVNDATAQYWNPAAFGFFGRQADDSFGGDEHSDKDFGLDIRGGGGFKSHNDFSEKLDAVGQNSNYDIISQDIQNGGLNVDNIDEFLEIVGDLEDFNLEERGVSFDVNASVNLRIRNWGVGAINTINVGASPRLDLVNINASDTPTSTTADLGNLPNNNVTLDSLTQSQFDYLTNYISTLPKWDATESAGFLYAVDDALALQGYTSVAVPQSYLDDAKTVARLANQSDSGGSFDKNTSFMEFRGASISEIPVTYGHAYNDELAVGISLKAMNATTYYQKVLVFQGDSKDVFKDATEASKDSTGFGIDLGVLYKMGNARFGLVGRNLNTPSFDWAGPGDYEVKPQLRAGAAYRLGDWVTLAADMDLTENEVNSLKSYKSKTVAIGAELDIFSAVRLRLGTYQNTAESDIGAVYTAGLGINLYLFQLDLGAAMSPEKANIDGDEVPEEFKAEAALSFQF